MEPKTSQFIAVSPDLAKTYLENNYRNQRPKRKDHIIFLANEMGKGTFTMNTIVIAENGTNQHYIVDGQHTLEAIVKSGVTIKLPVLHYHVNNQAELSALYATINTGVKRTYSDSLRAFGTKEVTGVPHAELNKLASAIRFFHERWPKHGVKKRIPSELVHELCMSWSEYFKRFLELTEGTHEDVLKKMKAQGAMAVFLAVLRFSESPEGQKDDFIRGVAAGSGLENGDPRRTLHYYMASFSGNGNRLKAVALATAVAMSWNAYVAGKPLEKIRESALSRKTSISGTKFVIGGKNNKGKSLPYGWEKAKSQ